MSSKSKISQISDHWFCAESFHKKVISIENLGYKDLIMPCEEIHFLRTFKRDLEFEKVVEKNLKPWINLLK